MKKILFLNILLLLICNTLSSQDIFSEVEKTDMANLENKVIEKARKQLKVDEQKNLFLIPAFNIELKKDFSGNTITGLMFIDNIKQDKDRKIVFLVYNDSLNVVTSATNLDEKAGQTHEKHFIM
jgi:hypothetical protein